MPAKPGVFDIVVSWHVSCNIISCNYTSLLQDILQYESSMMLRRFIAPFHGS